MENNSIKNSQYIIISIFFSILFIICSHQLYIFLMDRFTIKRTKNLVDYQTQKYKSILVDFMSNPDKMNSGSPEYLYETEKERMIENLEDYIQTL
jgi:hypothetical protein